MKKLLLTGALAALFLPGLALASNVTLTNDVILSVGGVTLNLSGATTTLSSITVESSSFSFDLAAGETLEVTSATGRVLSTSNTSYINTNTCTGGVSVLSFNTVSPVTITVSPSSGEACSNSATAGASIVVVGGGGGGGNGAPAGGGGGSAPTIVTTTAPSTGTGSLTAEQRTALIAQLTAQVKTLLAQLNALLAARGNSFAADLKLGSTGADVMRLQVYLNAHGAVVAETGPGSPGNETTRFGAATKAALIKFQKANGISPASGNFGPLTRAFVNANP